MSEVFLKIVNMGISASWLVLAVVILRLLLRKAPKWVNVLLWGIVAIRLICPFSIESALSLIPSGETVPMNIEMDATPAIDSGIAAVNSLVNPVISASFTPNPAASANPLQIWIPVAAVVWIAGMAVLLLYTAISYWCLRRKVQTAVLYRGNIFQSEAVSSPFVLGIFKPKIYLPFNISGQDLEHVVAHEQAHIRRKDHLWKPLGFLLLTLHWFNPLMWIAYVLLCRDIELACDEKVIEKLGSEQRADYTLALLACSVRRPRIAACPLAFGEVGVKERVKSVMHYKKPAFWIILVAVILCVAVAVCFLTDSPRELPSDAVTFEAEILKIYDGYFLVAPVEGSRELNSSDQLEVPMKNMDPSLEPEVGDIIEIAYSGEILETDPGRLREVYRLKVLMEAQLWDRIPMVMVDGELYLDTGYKSTEDTGSAVADGEITSTVDGSQSPTQNDQSNFGAGYEYRYSAAEGMIEINMNGSWWIFATEEVRHNMHIPVTTAFDLYFAGNTSMQHQIILTETQPFWSIYIQNEGPEAIVVDVGGEIYRIDAGTSQTLCNAKAWKPGTYTVGFATAGSVGMDGYALGTVASAFTPKQQESNKTDNGGSKFYLTIGAEGVTYIELSMPDSSGGCANADGSPFKKGERILLEPLDGYSDLRGLEITAKDQDGNIVWTASIPYTEGNQGFTHLRNDDWNITNIP